METTDVAIAQLLFNYDVQLLPCWQDFDCGDWRVCLGHNDPEEDRQWHIRCINKPCYSPVKGKDYIYWYVIPEYSKDPRATLLVIDELYRRDLILNVDFIPEHIACSIMKQVGADEWQSVSMSGSHPTFSEAICQGTLRYLRKLVAIQ